MKYLFFGLLLASTVGIFTACEQDNPLLQDEELMSTIMDSSQKTAVTQDDLPESIQGYMEENYPPVLVEEAFVVKDLGHELQLETGINVYFNDRNRFLGHRPHPHPRFRCLRGDTLDVTDLPQAILDYVAENLPDETIEVAVVKPFGLYAVGLSNDVILVFDEEGEFISRCGRWDGPGHPGRRCMRGEEIVIEDLPQSVTGYVTDNYPDETTEAAVTKPSGAYAVKLSDGTVLLFDADGVFIKECRA